MSPHEAAKMIAERLLHELPAEEVWLFGSQARGDATPDSDVDILVLVNESDLPPYKRASKALALVSSIPFPKDIVVLTRSEWQRQVPAVNTLPFIVQKEGIPLHTP